MCVLLRLHSNQPKLCICKFQLFFIFCVIQLSIPKAETTTAAAVGLDEWTKYCEDPSASKRRPTRTVWAGKVPIGSEHRIARQTMTTTDTNDVEATVAQASQVLSVSWERNFKVLTRYDAAIAAITISLVR